jgi:lipid II:glycine glycyltransferase (peptidoglycan interpeptide bridge formation enzyme)
MNDTYASQLIQLMQQLVTQMQIITTKLDDIEYDLRNIR